MEDLPFHELTLRRYNYLLSIQMKKSVQNSPNIDHNEIAKFEALATRWWDPESEFRTLHQINPLRLEFINERAPLEGKKGPRCGVWGWNPL